MTKSDLKIIWVVLQISLFLTLTLHLVRDLQIQAFGLAKKKEKKKKIGISSHNFSHTFRLIISTYVCKSKKPPHWLWCHCQVWVDLVTRVTSIFSFIIFPQDIILDSC